MLNGNRQLIHEWEANGMEEEGCRCGCKGGVEAGVHLQDLHCPHLRQRETRTCRTALILVVVLLLLVSAVTTIVIAVKSESGSHAQHDSLTKQQTKSQLCSPPGADGRQEVRTPSQNPRALFTASTDNNTNGTHLLWEHKVGRAYCQGFNYSNGDVVVLRDGFYRVSLQVAFQGDGQKCKSLILNTTVLYKHDSYDESRLLLSSYDTVICNGNTWMKSLHTSGSFHLQKNTILSVKLNHKDLMMKNEHELFFQIEFQPNS